MNKNICICITEMDSFSKYGWVCVGFMVHGEITLFTANNTAYKLAVFNFVNTRTKVWIKNLEICKDVCLYVCLNASFTSNHQTLHGQTCHGCINHT